eukprot:CAMPEP_0115167412 /NCGR_PEP_ID=MMETSP0270-20121206/204_1 /TAXON_ID=71861 /ORGANISM="Scrippsiella trochoidea, Strain CCMP3099" /LENGTH=215 /DNA_ID=CAMNT_0002580007 /DNA_START=436 /DNA_END=1080 /DNA_ORIENTATION=-
MKAKPNKVQAARRREKGFKTSSVAILCIDCWQFSLVSALSIKADTRFCVVFRVLLVLLLSTSCNSRHESLTMLTPCALALLEESLSKTFLGCPGKNSQSSVQQSRTTYASRAVKAFATKSNQRMATLCFDFSVLMLRGVPLGDAAFGSSPELCTLFELCMLLLCNCKRPCGIEYLRCGLPPSEGFVPLHSELGCCCALGSRTTREAPTSSPELRA